MQISLADVRDRAIHLVPAARFEAERDEARERRDAVLSLQRCNILRRALGDHRQARGYSLRALTAKDFGIFGEHGGSMVWSPFSNYLLYGATANVKTAKKAGVTIALGSDWSPSGCRHRF